MTCMMVSYRIQCGLKERPFTSGSVSHMSFFFLFFFFVWLSQSSFVAINVFDSCKSIFLFVVAIQSEFFFSVT